MALDDFQDILGQVIGVLAGIESIRKPGGIGDYFGTRLKAQTDPDTVMGLTGKPFLGGYYGVGGDVIPTYVDMPGGGFGRPAVPSNPEAQPIWTPQMPAIGPDAFLKRQGLQSEIASRYAAARLAEAQGATQEQINSIITRGGGPGGTLTGPGGMPITGIRLGKDPSINFSNPPPFVTPADSTLGTGEPIRGTIAGRTVVKTKPRAAAGDKAKAGADLARLRGGKEAFLAIFGPDAQGNDPLDLLPKASETTAAGLFRSTPGLSFFTSAGEGPGFLPGGAPSIPRLAREGDPRAVVLTHGQVVRSEVARGFGGLGNLNENEQAIVEEVLPRASDTRELAIAKRDFLSRVFDAVDAGLSAGQFQTEADLKKAFVEGAKQFRPGANPNLSQVTPSTEGTPSSVTTPAPTPYDPAQVEDDLKRFRKTP